MESKTAEATAALEESLAKLRGVNSKDLSESARSELENLIMTMESVVAMIAVEREADNLDGFGPENGFNS